MEASLGCTLLVKLWGTRCVGSFSGGWLGSKAQSDLHSPWEAPGGLVTKFGWKALVWPQGQLGCALYLSLPGTGNGSSPSCPLTPQALEVKPSLSGSICLSCIALNYELVNLGQCLYSSRYNLPSTSWWVFPQVHWNAFWKPVINGGAQWLNSWSLKLHMPRLSPDCVMHCCVTWKLPNFSVPKYPCLQNRSGNSTHS